MGHQMYPMDVTYNWHCCCGQNVKSWWKKSVMSELDDERVLKTMDVQ